MWGNVVIFISLAALHPTSCSFSVLEPLLNIEDTGHNEGWGVWGAWQPCSRSCGGGVTFMTRQCLDTRTDGLPGCVGPSRKYSSCNIQDCPDGSIDFRKEQCSLFNNQSYSGRYHRWKPYLGTSVSNPCELHCQPEDDSFFIKQADKVVDGTRCDINSFDVCIDGICQKVGCDMMLGSELVEDDCKECGGDGSTCYRVNDIFAAPNLPTGYTEILVIPAGATNIAIDEYRASRNYLAIRNSAQQYVLNGNWTINRSRAVQVAGTTVYYHRKLDRRKTPESLRASGPTTEDLYIELVVQERNKGIRYNFYLPQGIDDPNGGSVSWIAAEWNECSRDCGRGTQSRRLTCHKNGKKVAPYLCKASQRPQRRRQCNLQPCLARWHAGNWTECSESCNGGIHFRQVYCSETPQLAANSIGPLRLVQDSRCAIEDSSIRPPSQERCNEQPCPGWTVGYWSACSTSCDVGRQTREVTCHPGATCLPNSAPDRIRECNLGPCTGIQWVVTAWTLCTEKCGEGMQTRIVHCASEEGVMYDDMLCKDQIKPDSQRPCHSTTQCLDTPRWMTGIWSKCSAACGNGMQTRRVVCYVIRDSTYRVFPDEQCTNVDEKPPRMRHCSRPECEAAWFTGPWGLCSPSCGDGARTRQVMCLSEITFRPLAESDCDATKRPNSTGSCNSPPCLASADEPVEITEVRLQVTTLPDVECSLTPHGCCPDNQTPAQGSEMQGCVDVRIPNNAHCSLTTHGCCRDGVQPADGPNHHGCPEYEICYVRQDRGSFCGKWLARWYFDPQTSTCRHFWYGGCQGNRNNYDSKIECSTICENHNGVDLGSRRIHTQSTEVASTSTTLATTTLTTLSTTTTIPSTTSSTTLSTAATAKPSTTVVFRTSPATERIVQLQTTTSPPEALQHTTRVASGLADSEFEVGPDLMGMERRNLRICSRPAIKGPCFGRYMRWHYDQLDHSCKSFIFGGCGGNENNFKTRNDCLVTCKSDAGMESRTNLTHARTQCELERVKSRFNFKRSPQCDPISGRYRLLQCITDVTGTTQACWCVEPDTGREIDGSRRHGTIAPDCDHMVETTKTPGACSRTKYGCCRDGVTPSRGHRKSGCPEVVRLRPSRTSVTTRRGGSARISCPAVGFPRPSVRWFKDGREIEAGEPGVQVAAGGYSLIFITVRQQHIGSYVCTASNGVGSPQSRTISLKLQEDRIRFRTRPSNITVYEGQTAKLKCRFRGTPASISWFRNGRHLPPSNYVTIKPWGDLRLLRAVSSDSGRYTCMASSNGGEISASAQIRVLRRLKTTRPPTTTSVTSPVTSPSARRATTAELCLDYPKYADCQLILKAGMCHHRQYSKYCCHTCRQRRHRTVTTGRRRRNRVVTSLLR